LDEVGDFAAGPQALAAFDEFDGDFGAFCLEAVDLGDGWIIEAVDAEDDLKGCRIVLTAMALEASVHTGIDAFEGLEDGYALDERLGGAGLGDGADVVSGAEEGQQKVGDSG